MTVGKDRNHPRQRTFLNRKSNFKNVTQIVKLSILSNKSQTNKLDTMKKKQYLNKYLKEFSRIEEKHEIGNVPKIISPHQKLY